MWFWERKEFYHGFDMEKQANVRDILAANGIKYQIRVVSLSQKSRGRFGNLGLNSRFDTEYYIYVSQKDYDNAVFYLNQSHNGY